MSLNEPARSRNCAQVDERGEVLGKSCAAFARENAGCAGQDGNGEEEQHFLPHLLTRERWEIDHEAIVLKILINSPLKTAPLVLTMMASTRRCAGPAHTRYTLI